MKLSELRPCDSCDGPLRTPMNAGFYVVRSSLAIFKPAAANQVLGLTQIFQGALGLAEAMAPDPDVVLVAGDEQPELLEELLICGECYLGKPLDLPILVEKRNAAIARVESARGAQ